MDEVDIERLPYRRCVGIMLVNHEGLVFIGRRNDESAAWQMPQGGIDAGESPEQAALRELQEETGATKTRVIAESAQWHDYDLPPDLVPRTWGGRFRGQTQRWFLLEHLGKEKDIRPESVAHPEFDAWKWAPIDQLPGLAVAFKRAVYEAVVEEFGPFLKDLRKRKKP
jgi:putative (di)nucleoside polyphosphate hydrolase